MVEENFHRRNLEPRSSPTLIQLEKSFAKKFQSSESPPNFAAMRLEESTPSFKNLSPNPGARPPRISASGSDADENLRIP